MSEHNQLASQTVDANFVARLESDHQAIRNRLHESLQSTQAAILEQTKRNQDIDLKLMGIANTLENQNRETVHLTKIIEGIDKTVNGDGNGNPGIKALVRDHDKVISRIEKLFWAAITLLLAGVIGIFWKIVQHP